MVLEMATNKMMSEGGGKVDKMVLEMLSDVQ